MPPFKGLNEILYFELIFNTPVPANKMELFGT